MIPGLLTFVTLSVVNGLLLLVSYIANNTFPQPLSEEEEAKYLQLLMGGDEQARNILTERNLRLVAHIVKKFDKTVGDTDDLISIGTIGLIKAVNTYNMDKGTKLATYAARCIENEFPITVPQLINYAVYSALDDTIFIYYKYLNSYSFSIKVILA